MANVLLLHLHNKKKKKSSKKKKKKKKLSDHSLLSLIEIKLKSQRNMNNIDDEPENANINDMLCIIPGFYPKSYSFGFINNDNSFSHTIPSMLAYISLMFFASKAVYYSLRPLKQPRVVCDLIVRLVTIEIILDINI